MTRLRDESHEALHRFTVEHDALHPYDIDAARAACLVLDEVKRLHQLLRDLIDFSPRPHRTDLTPRNFERCERAWSAAIAEVGPRNQRRFEVDDL